MHIISFFDNIVRNFKGISIMNEINFSKIDMHDLQKLKSNGTQSTIYTDGNLCYKFLDGLYSDEKSDLYKKFLDMDGIEIENVLLPQDLIIENGKLKGYTMRYFANSMPLSDKFLKRYFNCNELLLYVDKASRILRTIHSNGIACQDLSFDNILVDDQGNVAFCDIDGCIYLDYYTPFLSKICKEFIVDYRGIKMLSLKNIDKVSMILSFYLILYGETLQKITKRQYHLLSDNIQTLENLKEIANRLVDKNSSVCDFPYLDEVIDLTDDYVVDRKRILTLKQKLKLLH